MQSDYFLDKQVDFAKDENIKSMIYIIESENQTITKKYIHKIIFGVEDYSKIKSLIKKFIGDSTVILSKITEEISIDIKITNYVVLFEDANLYQLIFLENGDIYDYMKLYKKYIVLLDREDKLSEKLNDTFNSNWTIPDKNIFIEECIDFYLELVQMALNYEENNISKAYILKNSILDRLVYMINSYLSIKYNNGIKVNQYGDNFSVYLDKEYYEEYIHIIVSNGEKDLWTSIFKSAQLFRFIALQIAERKEFIYPKKEDVQTMKLLRELYNKE